MSATTQTTATAEAQAPMPAPVSPASPAPPRAAGKDPGTAADEARPGIGSGVEHFEFAGVSFTVAREPGRWAMPLRHADVPVTSAGQLAKLSFHHDALMACEVGWQDEEVTLRLEVDPGWVTFAELAGRPRADKLRAMANIAPVADLVDMGFAVILDPANVLFDRNLRPKLAYRGLAGLMPPAGMDQAMFLRQYQALVLALFDKKATFASVFDGAMTLKHASDFDKAITLATSPEEISAYLLAAHDEQVAEDEARLARVSRRGHQVFKHAAIWLAVLLAGAVAGLAYYTFMYAPFQERMLQADTGFVKKDYDGLIETLRPVPEAQLPLTQRYELAFAFVQGTNLSDEQHTAIMNNLSLNSDPQYLGYWIQVGRGQLAKALDTAKGLNDPDLILYAITLNQSAIKDDTRLSGTDKAAQLEQLSQDYQKYLAARTTQINSGKKATASPAPAASAKAGAKASAGKKG